MTTSNNFLAKSIGINSQEIIPLKDIKQRLISGEVILVPECLPKIGFYEQVKQASLEGIQQAIGEEKTAQLKSKGFEAFHDIISLDELPKVSDRTYKTIRSITPELSKAIVKEVFQQKQPFYCLDRSPYKNNYIYTLPHDGIKAKLTESIAGITRRVAKKIDSTLIKSEEQYIISPDKTGVFDDTSANFPKPILIATDKQSDTDKTNLVFDSSNLPVGSVKPVSEQICAARLDSDRVNVTPPYNDGACVDRLPRS